MALIEENILNFIYIDDVVDINLWAAKKFVDIINVELEFLQALI